MPRPVPSHYNAYRGEVRGDTFFVRDIHLIAFLYHFDRDSFKGFEPSNTSKDMVGTFDTPADQLERLRLLQAGSIEVNLQEYLSDLNNMKNRLNAALASYQTY